MRLKDIKESIEDSLHAESSKLHKTYKTNGWKIDSSVHARARAQIRHPNKSSEEWEKFHRNVARGLINCPKTPSGFHVIFSKSHNMGVAAHVDREHKKVSYISVLPSGRSHAKTGDTELKVESVEFEVI
jgi:hypothetical protein